MTFKQILNLLLNRIYIIVGIPLIAMIATVVVVFNFVDPTYTAFTTVYVLNKTNEELTQQDINASEALTSDYKEIAMSYGVLDTVAKEFGYASRGDLLEVYDISVTPIPDTRIMKISVSGKDKTMVDDVANTIGHYFKINALRIMKLDNIEIVDQAKEPLEPSAPNKTASVIIAGAAGFIFALAIVMLAEALNTTIRTSEDVERVLGLPILAKIPKMEEVE